MQSPKRDKYRSEINRDQQRDYSTSPSRSSRKKERGRSKESKKKYRSGSRERRDQSRSPDIRKRCRSRSNEPRRRERSRSNEPRRRERSRSNEPRRRERSRSNEPRRRERSRSNDPKEKHKPRSNERSGQNSQNKRERSLSKDNKIDKKLSTNKNAGPSGSKDKTKRKDIKSKKHKKDKHHSSGSESSSSDSDSEMKLLQKLEVNRQLLIQEKQKQKELMKANETPEEKRARRLRKKQLKERSRRARMGWDTEYQAYTDLDNPFGDSTLTDTFIWNKKLAKEGVTNVSREELDALNRQKQLENKIELEKVKARRLERAAAGALEAGAARAREDAHYSSWAAQEDAFHLQQARLRSLIRIRDSRAKPIDLLAWYISGEEAADALHMHEPYTFLQGLSAADLEDLQEDIKVYMEVEGGAHAEYWRDVAFIAQDEAARLSRAPQRPAVHASVAGDVTQLLKGKSGAQLQALEQQIAARLARREGVDVSYWESLLTQLNAHMARARLRELHQRTLRRKLELLQQEQGLRPQEEPPAAADDAPAPAAPVPDTAPEEHREAAAEGSASEGEGEEGEGQEEAARGLYRRGGYSPPRLPRAEPGAVPRDAEEDRRHLAYLRARAASQPTATSAGGGGGGEAGGPGEGAGAGTERALEAAMRAAEAGAGGEGGAGGRFSVEAPLRDAPPLWADKYRPRKPRYFNRVHTGFEWNKYNQTHYDMDNPPPKVVQGYKFNIFYPELIDKRATPSFSLKPCPENPEFAILRFSAGPPYEDIAFKVVHREWEYSYKRGFRCHFHNNIFQLWFHFKRYRYRR